MEGDIQPLGVGLIQYVNGLRVIFEKNRVKSSERNIYNQKGKLNPEEWLFCREIIYDKVL